MYIVKYVMQNRSFGYPSGREYEIHRLYAKQSNAKGAMTASMKTGKYGDIAVGAVLYEVDTANLHVVEERGSVVPTQVPGQQRLF